MRNNNDDNEPRARCSFSQVLAALSISMGSLVAGFSLAYTSPALVTMTDTSLTPFKVTAQSESWIGGVMPLSSFFGAIAGGLFLEKLGRRNTILATGAPFIISWLLIACAVNVKMVLIGRTLAGFCIGVNSLSFPIYLVEAIQFEVRGTLGLLPTAFGNIGILLCFIFGTYLHWNELALMGAALLIPFLVLMCLIPETPKWYISHNKLEQSRKALIWLRAKDADIEDEFNDLKRMQSNGEKNDVGKNKFMKLFRLNNVKPLSISLGLMFFQQLSGINAIIFYTVAIFNEADSTIDSNTCTIIVGIVNLLSTFVATFFIDYLLLYISDITMILTLSALGSYFYYQTISIQTSHISWLPLTSVVIYIIGFSLGFGPIPWLMMGEILPANIRSTAASVATAFNWTCVFIVTKMFHDMIVVMGLHGAFWLFGAICFIGIIFLRICVPETRGKTLEDIEDKMSGRTATSSSTMN